MGVELKATLKFRKLLIARNEKNAKNIGFAQPRYTPGTRLELDWVGNAVVIRRAFDLFGHFRQNSHLRVREIEDLVLQMDGSIVSGLRVVEFAFHWRASCTRQPR